MLQKTERQQNSHKLISCIGSESTHEKDSDVSFANTAQNKLHSRESEPKGPVQSTDNIAKLEDCKSTGHLQIRIHDNATAEFTSQNGSTHNTSNGISSVKRSCASEHLSLGNHSLKGSKACNGFNDANNSQLKHITINDSNCVSSNSKRSHTSNGSSAESSTAFTSNSKYSNSLSQNPMANMSCDQSAASSKGFCFKEHFCSDLKACDSKEPEPVKDYCGTGIQCSKFGQTNDSLGNSMCICKRRENGIQMKEDDEKEQHLRKQLVAEGIGLTSTKS